MSTLKTNQFHLIEDLDIAALTFAAVERVEELATTTKNTLSVWRRRSNDRHQLASMDSRLLDDIGLTHADVLRESKKLFWQK